MMLRLNAEKEDLDQQELNDMEETREIEMPELSKNPVFGDDRGLFFPLALSNEWVQSNISISRKWTFRGLHHQLGNFSQKKKVTVITGSIIDFVVDLRQSRFGEAQYFHLSPGNTVTVPRGFAHGFLALEDNTQIQYLVDNMYSPSNEISFDWKSVPLVKKILLEQVADERNLQLSVKDTVGKSLTPEYTENLYTVITKQIT